MQIILVLEKKSWNGYNIGTCLAQGIDLGIWIILLLGKVLWLWTILVGTYPTLLCSKPLLMCCKLLHPLCKRPPPDHNICFSPILWTCLIISNFAFSILGEEYDAEIFAFEVFYGSWSWIALWCDPWKSGIKFNQIVMWSLKKWFDLLDMEQCSVDMEEGSSVLYFPSHVLISASLFQR